MDFKIADNWYKAMAVAGVALAVAALAAKHDDALLIGLGLVAWGLGEFANHPYREEIGFDQFGRANAKISGHPWRPSLLGAGLDVAGLVLIGIGLWRLVF